MIDIISDIIGLPQDFEWLSYIVASVVLICFIDSLFNLVASIFKGVGGYK